MKQKSLGENIAFGQLIFEVYSKDLYPVWPESIYIFYTVLLIITMHTIHFTKLDAYLNKGIKN